MQIFQLVQQIYQVSVVIGVVPKNFVFRAIAGAVLYEKVGVGGVQAAAVVDGLAIELVSNYLGVLLDLQILFYDLSGYVLGAQVQTLLQFLEYRGRVVGDEIL